MIGVADELPRTVVGDVAAAPDGVDRDAAAAQLRRRGQHVPAAAPRGDAERDDRRVLEQQQPVRDALRLPEGHQPPLPAGRGVVGDDAEPVHLERRATGRARRPRRAGRLGWRPAGARAHDSATRSASNDSSPAFTRAMKRSASAPSISRWSKPSVR